MSYHRRSFGKKRFVSSLDPAYSSNEEEDEDDKECCHKYPSTTTTTTTTTRHPRTMLAKPQVVRSTPSCEEDYNNEQNHNQHSSVFRPMSRSSPSGDDDDDSFNNNSKGEQDHTWTSRLAVRSALSLSSDEDNNDDDEGDEEDDVAEDSPTTTPRTTMVVAARGQGKELVMTASRSWRGKQMAIQARGCRGTGKLVSYSDGRYSYLNQSPVAVSPSQENHRKRKRNESEFGSDVNDDKHIRYDSPDNTEEQTFEVEGEVVSPLHWSEESSCSGSEDDNNSDEDEPEETATTNSEETIERSRVSEPLPSFYNRGKSPGKPPCLLRTLRIRLRKENTADQTNEKHSLGNKTDEVSDTDNESLDEGELESDNQVHGVSIDGDSECDIESEGDMSGLTAPGMVSHENKGNPDQGRISGASCVSVEGFQEEEQQQQREPGLLRRVKKLEEDRTGYSLEHSNLTLKQRIERLEPSGWNNNTDLPCKSSGGLFERVKNMEMEVGSAGGDARLSLKKRIENLELDLFGSVSENPNFKERVKRLEYSLFGDG